MYFLNTTIFVHCCEHSYFFFNGQRNNISNLTMFIGYRVLFLRPGILTFDNILTTVYPKYLKLYTSCGQHTNIGPISKWDVIECMSKELKLK